MKIQTSIIKWSPSFRIISDRYPALTIFERIADPANFDSLLELAAMTNPALQPIAENAMRFKKNDRFIGSGAERIWPSFAFLDLTLDGSRFSTADFGAYYAGKDMETAIRETIFHREKFMKEAKIEVPQDLDQLVILADIDDKFHDIRDLQQGLPEVYRPDDYKQSQAFATKLKEDGSNGIVYSSVRWAKGECIAIFRPASIKAAGEKEEHLSYRWNGSKIEGYFFKSKYRPLQN